MTPKGVERERADKSREDMISNLPRDIICCILVKMPIRDAIRTTVLSKSWVFHYFTIPELVFDDQFCRELKHITKKKSRIFKHQFDKTITKYLLLHTSPIQKLKVCIPFKSWDDLNVYKWVVHLSRKNIIKRLTLLHNSNFCPKLPLHFFFCRGLTHLKLSNVALSSPPEFEGFPNLDQLVLRRVNLANHVLQCILSRCPVLDRLVLHRCSGISHFNISGSNLKRLLIRDNYEFKSICLSDAPNLTEVSVNKVRVEDHEVYPVPDLVKFMDGLPKVRVLHLNGLFLKFLAAGAGEVPTRLPFDLNCVKLHLSGINLDELFVVSCVLCLLRSFPCLQYLEIQVDDYDDEVPALLSLEVERFLDVTFDQLRVVKLERIIGTKPQMQLIKLLLVKSPVLERLLIEPLAEDEVDKVIVKILAELTRFQRASPKAEAVYNLDKHPKYGAIDQSTIFG